MIRFISGLFAFGVTSACFGVLAFAGIFAWFARDLPRTEQLASYEPATLSRVHSGDGVLMAEFARERRLYTPIDEIPDLVRHAFISAEDKHFYLHTGVDGLGLIKAMVDNVRRYSSGQGLRGASTITQQVVKNFLLSGEKAIERKIKEALLAQRLESALSKDQILELYLNEIFLGSNSYGVTAATANYFGKRLEELEPQEVAFLAALPKAPSTYHPVRRKEAATDRRNYVLKEMRENGYITEEEYKTARAQPLETLMDKPLEERRRIRLHIDYFSEEIRRELVDKMGEDKVYGGGLSIRATVDPELQDLARRTLQKRLFDYSVDRGYIGPTAQIEEFDPADWRKQLAKTRVPRDLAPWKPAVVLEVGQRSARIGVEGVESDEAIYLPFSDVREWAIRREKPHLAAEGPAPGAPSDVWAVGDVIYVEQVTGDDGALSWSMRQIPNVNGALVAMDPHTGRVLAMQGGFSYQSSVFNRATQAKRQPGSSFKPFVYAAALESGYRPNTIVLDAPVVLPQLDGDDWKPKNYSGKFYGPSPLRWGIEKSQNLMTVRVAMEVGLEKVAEYAETFGVYDEMPPLLSYALGAGETTLMKMTASYAMFVNGGKRIDPTLIDRIQDRHGQTIFRHDDRICTECLTTEWYGQPEPYVPDEGQQVLDPVTAYQLVSMMEGVAVRGTASSLGANLDFAVGGKTGTTNDAKDAWFIGFSPDLVVGCFVGFDNPRTLGKRMSGGTLCAPVFESFMAEAMKDRPKFEFRRPEGAVLKKIDSKTGACVADSAQGKQYIWEAFRNTDNPCAIASIGGFELRTIPSTDATQAATPGQQPQRPQRPTNSLGSGIW